MEPSNLQHWSDATFVISAKITFSIRKRLKHMIPESEMLSAVVLADREHPWWHDGQAARLTILRPPQLFLENDTVVVYSVAFQSACTLTPSQLSSYVKYTAQLAENAQKFVVSPDAVNWIGSTVHFEGTSIVFDVERSAHV